MWSGDDKKEEEGSMVLWSSDDSDSLHDSKEAFSRPMTAITESELYAFEEYDKKVALEVTKLLQDLEDDCFAESISPTSHHDSIEWGSIFPHIRVTGRTILSNHDSGFQYYPPPTNGSHVHVNSLEHICVVGSAINIRPVSVNEEIFASDGETEEIYFCDPLGLSVIPSSFSPQTKYGSLTPVKSIREEIISSIFDALWGRITPILTPCIFEILKKEKPEVYRHASYRSLSNIKTTRRFEGELKSFSFISKSPRNLSTTKDTDFHKFEDSKNNKAFHGFPPIKPSSLKVVEIKLNIPNKRGKRQDLEKKNREPFFSKSPKIQVQTSFNTVKETNFQEKMDAKNTSKKGLNKKRA